MLSTLNPGGSGGGREVEGQRSGRTELGEDEACASEQEIKGSEPGGQVFALPEELLLKLNR